MSDSTYFKQYPRKATNTKTIYIVLYQKKSVISIKIDYHQRNVGDDISEIIFMRIRSLGQIGRSFDIFFDDSLKF